MFSSTCAQVQLQWLHQRRGRYPNRCRRASYWATLIWTNGGWAKSLVKGALAWSTWVLTLDNTCWQACSDSCVSLWDAVLFGPVYWSCQNHSYSLKFIITCPNNSRYTVFMFTVSFHVAASKDVDRPVAANTAFVIKVVRFIILCLLEPNNRDIPAILAAILKALASHLLLFTYWSM